MPDPSEASSRHIDARITSLEELLTHFERTVHELDGVVQQVQDRLDSLEGRVAAMGRQVRESLTPEDGGVPGQAAADT